MPAKKGTTKIYSSKNLLNYPPIQQGFNFHKANANPRSTVIHPKMGNRKLHKEQPPAK